MFILYKEVINASIAFNQICGSSAILMDGEQPFLARDDDERLVFFSFTALLDVIKNVGWMVCVHLNEC